MAVRRAAAKRPFRPLSLLPFTITRCPISPPYYRPHIADFDFREPLPMAAASRIDFAAARSSIRFHGRPAACARCQATSRAPLLPIRRLAASAHEFTSGRLHLPSACSQAPHARLLITLYLITRHIFAALGYFGIRHAFAFRPSCCLMICDTTILAARPAILISPAARLRHESSDYRGRRSPTCRLLRFAELLAELLASLHRKKCVAGYAARHELFYEDTIRREFLLR